MIRTVCAALVFGATLAATAPGADRSSDWPQWRGPTRDGRVPARAWPDSLSDASLQQVWRVDQLGPSYSGPIVSADRVFTTETRDKKFEVVRAYDRASGRELWSAQWPGAMDVPFFARSNGSWIRSTPACDGDRLYVGGMRDVLVCLNAADGKEIWRFDFMEKLQSPLPAFGLVCSPLVDGDALYVQAGAACVRLDKHTGRLVWRSLADDGGMMGSAFSSPVLADVGGQRQLLVQTRLAMAGVDPEDGRELWRIPIPADRGMNIFTPVALGDGFFASSYGGGSRRIAVSKLADGWAPKQSWELKSQGYMSTPVVIDGHAYMHLRNQRLMCIDLTTGKECWTTSQVFGKYWSMTANGDRILALDEKGILYLIHATPEKFDLVDSRKISSAETWGHLAICGDEIYIRELNALAKHRWR